jgi:hypothetical protein
VADAPPATAKASGSTFGFLGKKVFGKIPVWVIAVAGVGAYYWYTKYGPGKKNAAGAMQTDPAGNQCGVINPDTGYCPGTPEDTAALASGAASGTDTSGAAAGTGTPGSGGTSGDGGGGTSGGGTSGDGGGSYVPPAGTGIPAAFPGVTPVSPATVAAYAATQPSPSAKPGAQTAHQKHLAHLAEEQHDAHAAHAAHLAHVAHVKTKSPPKRGKK